LGSKQAHDSLPPPNELVGEWEQSMDVAVFGVATMIKAISFICSVLDLCFMTLVIARPPCLTLIFAFIAFFVKQYEVPTLLMDESLPSHKHHVSTTLEHHC
jgi:hypothetical protein